MTYLFVGVVLLVLTVLRIRSLPADPDERTARQLLAIFIGLIGAVFVILSFAA